MATARVLTAPKPQTIGVLLTLSTGEAKALKGLLDTTFTTLPCPDATLWPIHAALTQTGIGNE